MDWSWLKPVAKIGLGVAAPFTGGASLLGIPAIDAIGAAAEGVGGALSAAGAAKAKNRGTELEAQTDLEKLLMQRDQQYQGMAINREQEGRAGTQDAWRKLQGAQHLLSPGAQPQLSPYSVAPRVAGEAERGGADAMTQQMLLRLQGGNPIAAVAPRTVMDNEAAFRVNPGLMKAGKGESALGWLGAGAGGFGAALGALKKK